ncbi:16S rRNA (cytosine967-C5)-methyltransferase [Ornithinibacillus halophilus]|uniref:16S rRNA (cytosine(967)-C(5))-methyltransferase n=1 Tax=Ornithinibacillus halophilus TaxID=930117 RepID=A0A1M5C7G1_9BACI|nr:16S rRNA (cytosine967-C5)-methyltransferase [Ornithinibacillus halophilus]
MLRNTIIDLLMRIEQDSGYSHLLINNEIKKRNISPKDEGLLTEIVYGTLQRKITLDYYINHFVTKKLEKWVSVLLRMSIYQMVYLDKVPDHAIIHEAVEIAKQRGHKGISSLVNGVLRNVQRKGVPDTSEIKNDVTRLSVETSHPEWLVKRWIDLYGLQITKDICRANLNHKPISVRVQPLRITREDAVDNLMKQGYDVEPSPFSPQGIVVKKGNVIKSDLFKDGYVTIQDQSSMLVAEMLKPQPGMHVLDACSAPGGKVTHIAEKMQNNGVIQAHDLHKNKIKLIEQKANDLHLSIIDASPLDARKLKEKYPENTFDRILIDAPCSGLGVIRGKPDIKYNKQKEDITKLATIQIEILNQAIPLLKRNGFLVYSTCTIDQEENEKVVERFLQANPSFSVDSSFFEELPEFLQDSLGVTKYGLQLFPHSYDTDGFFLTRLKRR